MLTRGDDYPLHQRPEPIAYAGGHRNFYDRYFFNGMQRDGETYFAAALGVYPVRNVMDASFSVIHQGTQHAVHASRALGMERMDTRVGPITIDVLEPLKKLRVRVEPNPYGISADFVFDMRARAFEEPRFFRRIGPSVFMDYTRLTQHGAYHGWVEIEGTRLRLQPDRWWGTRDRSWGIRPVGEREAPGGVNAELQFCFLWAPLNFEDTVVLFDTNEDGEGIPWQLSGMRSALGEVEPEILADVQHRIDFRSGTRHARRAELTLVPRRGPEAHVELEPLYHFYMLGLGYGHPEWGHGVFKGENALGGEKFKLSEVDETQLPYQHIEAIVRARVEGREGVGVLEQLILGPQARYGFTELLDFAP